MTLHGTGLVSGKERSSSSQPAEQSLDPRSTVAVIVLSLHAPLELVGAVRSLLSQNTVPEIVVVNSGGGDARSLLDQHALSVRVLEYQQVLFAGAARNAGIAATQAPIVAFLASDCLAQAGWVAARIARHRAGHTAVASAVVNNEPHNLFAYTAHISNFAPRLPRVPTKNAICYGASYHRSLFDQYGRFREDLRSGEDTEFHARLKPRDKPTWAPEIRTAHRNPTTFAALLTDQFNRGRNAAGAYCMIGGPSLPTLVKNGYRGRVLRAHRIARYYSDEHDLLLAAGARGLSPLAATAYVCGVLAYRTRQARHRHKTMVSGAAG